MRARVEVIKIRDLRESWLESRCSVVELISDGPVIIGVIPHHHGNLSERTIEVVGREVIGHEQHGVGVQSMVTKLRRPIQSVVETGCS